MSGPKRNPDRLNTIGIVVVGICGAVLVYVTIVALQAFYMDDTSEVQTMADYGGNDTNARSIKTAAMRNITELGANPVDPKKPNATYRITIDDAMKLVVESAKVDPSQLVPSQGRADKATIKPIYGRPQAIQAPAPTPPATDGAGSGSAAPAGAGSGSAAATPPAEMAPTGGLGQGGAPAAGAGSGNAAAVPAPAVNLPREQGNGTQGTGSAAPAPKNGP